MDDNIWEHRYQQLTGFVKKHGHTNLPADGKHEVLKDWLFRQIQHKSYLSESQFRRLDLLDINWELVTTRDQHWKLMYAKLKRFQETYGHCQVPLAWPKDKPLANWVRRQRQNKTSNKLLPEREKLLQEIKFNWHIQALYDSQWQHHFSTLRKFYQVHGHCRVPGKYKELTSWIENQRTAKKNNLLLTDRERQLSEVEFIWNYDDIKRNHWALRLKQLGAFKRKYGHGFVPVNYKENKALGTWVASQRKQEAKGKLPGPKKKKLDQVGFVWRTEIRPKRQANYEAQWNLNFERLKIYQQVYGTCQVSLKINPELQRWTSWQRKLFYAGSLPAERLAKLNEINFPWNIQEGYWMKMYEALADFKEQFGHTQVPFQWSPNRPLAAWVYRMKKDRLNLSAQKLELLEMIGLDWHLNQKTVVSWEGMYERLVKFKEDYGHTRVPVNWPLDPKLGKWVSRMRYEKEYMYPERLKLLAQISFDWNHRLVQKQVT